MTVFIVVLFEQWDVVQTYQKLEEREYEKSSSKQMMTVKVLFAYIFYSVFQMSTPKNILNIDDWIWTNCVLLNKNVSDRLAMD